jgi:hypothetical protein
LNGREIAAFRQATALDTSISARVVRHRKHLAFTAEVVGEAVIVGGKEVGEVDLAALLSGAKVVVAGHVASANAFAIVEHPRLGRAVT